MANSLTGDTNGEEYMQLDTDPSNSQDHAHSQQPLPTTLHPKLEELLQWRRTYDSYRARLQQLEALLQQRTEEATALQGDEDNSVECEEQLLLRIEQLQQGLLWVMGRQSVEELIIKRLYDQPHILNAVHLPENPAKEERQFRRQLVERDVLASQFLKENDKLKSIALENMMRSQEIKAIMKENEAIQQDIVKVSKSAVDGEGAAEIERNTEEILNLRKKRSVVANALMGIILESGVNWHDNEKYRRYIEEAEGHWVDEFLDEIGVDIRR